jgi:hypothetical protein
LGIFGLKGLTADVARIGLDGKVLFGFLLAFGKELLTEMPSSSR